MRSTTPAPSSKPKLYLLLTLFLGTGGLASAAPIPEEVKDPIVEDIADRLSWRAEKPNAALQSLLPDVEVYRLWLSRDEGGQSQSLSTYVFYDPERSSVVDIVSTRKEKLLAIAEQSEIELDSPEKVQTLFKTIGDVEEVIERKPGYFLIFNGDTFFDHRSGYKLTVDESGNISEVEQELKLAKKEDS